MTMYAPGHTLKNDGSGNDGNENTLVVTASEAPSHPRAVVSLDGDWNFQFGDETPTTISVPAPWESARPDLINKAGTAVYERSFTVPSEFQGKRVVARFGAVDYYCEAWVNGVSVGSHEGGYTPFEFRIDGALQGYGPDVMHGLIVRVTDSTVNEDAHLPSGEILKFAEIPHGKQSWYTSVGGIWQSVTVETRPEVTIDRVAFHPDIDAGAVGVYVTIIGALPGSEEEWKVRISVDAPRGAGAVPMILLPISGSTTRDGESLCLQTTLQVPDAMLWSPDQPALYHALITLERDGEVVDVRPQRFGMRKVESKEGRVWLNGKPLFLCGALDQDFYPRTIYTTPSEAFLRDQFTKVKEMGLNLLRCHIKVPDPLYLDLCDEMGILVWYELPNGARLSQGFRERAKKTIEEMWDRDSNHPCIVILTIMNESWGIDLNDGEQRRWLSATYRWAKELASDWLVVDNSACIPNFHVASDLDDYHVYFNIPDQAEDFAEWVRAFADREAGTFTGYGDAEYRRNEPLLISEFGNWGLPSVKKILEAEGREPYWFKTGEGGARPAKVLDRFEQQQLARVFKDYDALADASQEQEWLSLKWEIEEMRLRPQMAGYVITELCDVNWECNGLLDMARNPKVFHDRLKDLQAQDILIPRLSPRASFWEGETVGLTVSFSCFSGRSIHGGKIVWDVENCPGLNGEEPVKGLDGSLGGYGAQSVAQIWIQAPPVTAPGKYIIRLALFDARGKLVARANQNIVFVPASRRTLGQGRTVWLYDPLQSAIGLSSLLTSLGCRVTTQPEQGALGLVTRWDPAVSAFLHTAGTAVLVATHSKSITIASGLGVRLLERNTNGWWGDWCTSKAWFVPEHFPSLPDTIRFDFEYQPIVPERVLTGPPPENVLAGLYVGWLHNPAALVARLPIGPGNLVVTTFDLLPNVGGDPIATLMLNDLFSISPATRPE